jgi:26S proteasome regulatory subunit N3
MQLDYTAAHSALTQAVRKAPQSGSSVGFLVTAQKFSIIVQLLMGEIPDRSLFRATNLRKPLLPYFHLTQGRLQVFDIVCDF